MFYNTPFSSSSLRRHYHFLDSNKFISFLFIIGIIILLSINVNDASCSTADIVNPLINNNANELRDLRHELESLRVIIDDLNHDGNAEPYILGGYLLVIIMCVYVICR